MQYKSSREFRTINTDVYEIGVQKSGRVDVTFPSRDMVFAGACPMVWIDGEPKPRPLQIGGRASGRDVVNTRLGKGQGLLLQKGNCAWVIQGYPGKPYLSVQVAFVNTTKQPVKVKMLSPWTIGEDPKSGFSLGASTDGSAIIENGHDLYSNGDLPQRVTGGSFSLWNVAVFNPATQRSLIAGFLTNKQAYTQFRIARGPKTDSAMFGQFRAECVYDPPIEVPPDQRLESEVLYLSVGETNPLEGLERFGKMMAEFNGIERPRVFLPHGWDSWNTKYKTDITEERMLAALDFLDKNLKRYGWNHFAVDAGWELGKGNWEPDPARFPHGMKWLADQIHARGMTAGIWLDPFTVRKDSPVAQAHPDWLAQPSDKGREMLEDNEAILDVTVPEACAYVKELCNKIGHEWGYDALQECDFVYHLLGAESYANASLTRMEVMRVGMQAVRDGFGEDKFVTTFTPLPVTGMFANAMRIGDDCAPIWRKDPAKWPWGCVEAMTNVAHRYYYAPNVWVTDPDCAYFGHADTRARWDVADKSELTWDQSVAWLTAAAITGSVVKIGEWFPDLSEKEVGVLRRLLPTLRRPARPVDLFERDTPCIWSLPIKSRIGEWQIAAVFNWDETAPQVIPLVFAQLGLDPGAHYTVYDFWKDKYYGLARGQLNVETAPGSVHLLGLRRYEDHPMFLSTDRHFTQGATDFTSLTWNPQTRQLAATFDGVADTDYNLRVLVPEGYAFASASVSTGEVKTEQEGNILKLAFHCREQGPVNWTVQF